MKIKGVVIMQNQQDLRKNSIFFFIIMFLLDTDSFIITPLLPTLIQQFHISTDTAGWLVSAYALGYAGFSLFTGPFSEGKNRKLFILTGLCIFSIATAFCGIASNFLMMLIFRILAGIAASFITPQVWASVSLIAKGDREKLACV